ncbi:MAG: hypothetical protein Q9169_002388 [Polycauliona sp. 2 TL-2023]
MLRLAPTRISLTSADLDWHVRRHEKRLAKAKNGETTRTKAESLIHQSKLSKYQPAMESNSTATSSQRGDLVPIYSDEPVPQNIEESQPFWSGILAEVGAVARGNQISAVRSHPLETSSENTGSVRLSVPGQEEFDWSHGGAQGNIEISPRSPVSLPQSPASDSGSWTSASTQILSRRTPIALPGQLTDEHRVDLKSSDSSDLDLDLESMAANATTLQAITSIQEYVATSQHSRVNEMDVDGSSDTGPALHHYRSTSSLQDAEPGLRGMPFGAHARKAELAASRNASANSSQSDMESRCSDVETPDRALQDACSPPLPSQHMRTRSGGLPRSRLYISELVASSSPEKRQWSAAGSDLLPVSPNEIGLVPARVRKRYKRRDSSSFVGSEASDDHTRPAYSTYASENPFDGPARTSSPEPVPRNPLEYASLAGGPPEPYDDPQLLSPPTAYPHRFSSHSSNFSSHEDLPSYNYSLLPRQPFQHSRVPTSPMPRTPSNHINPLSFIPTPARENTSYIRPAYAPTTPPSRSSSISLHPTHISIYNDSLPSYSQPQTPIGLPRNGLPRMYHPISYYTAPARQGGGSLGSRRGRVAGTPDVLATPTRGDGRQRVGVVGDGRPGGRHNDQENVDVDVEGERRRQRERGSWTGGWFRGWRIPEWEP